MEKEALLSLGQWEKKAGSANIVDHRKCKFEVRGYEKQLSIIFMSRKQ